MEDKSFVVIRSILPKEWVIHEYKPDYGIDMIVEIFNYLDEAREKADTLGEIFLAQVKSVKQASITKLSVYQRQNVEKSPLDEDKSESHEIDVISFQIDTNELLTVQAMGAGLPVLLLLVPLNTQRVFFICLNDLIDKVILPNDPYFAEKGRKTIYIPVKNEVTSNENSLIPIRFYAKRSKLYSAFSKFAYQEHELYYLQEIIPIKEIANSREFRVLRHFLETILRYDFWETTEMWTPIRDCYQDILELERIFDKLSITGKLSKEDIMIVSSIKEPSGISDEEFSRFLFISLITTTWKKLKNLNNMYEEICREWFLPTYLGQEISYDRC